MRKTLCYACTEKLGAVFEIAQHRFELHGTCEECGRKGMVIVADLKPLKKKKE